METQPHYQIHFLLEHKILELQLRIQQTHYVKVTNYSFYCSPLPNINLNTNGNENELVCSNLPTFFVRLDAAIQDGTLQAITPINGQKTI
jgi:hypothetical protein